MPSGPGIYTSGRNIEYNGVSFPYAHKCSIKTTPVPSFDGRNYKYIEWVVSVEAIFSGSQGVSIDQVRLPAGELIASDPADDVFQLIYKRLSEPGQVLYLDNVGVGETEGPRNGWCSRNADLAWGPKPSVTSWEPVGSNLAMKIVWECKLSIKYCNATTNAFPGLTYPSSTDLLDFGFGEVWSLTDEGLTTRTIRGQYEIPARRVQRENAPSAAFLLQNNADTIRDTVVASFPRLPNYKRTQNFELSPDAKTLSFTIVDAEIPSDNPFFRGTTDIQVSRSVSSSLPFAKHTFTLEGRIRVLPSFPMIWGWFVFVLLVDYQIYEANRFLNTYDTDKNEEQRLKKNWLPASYQIKEELFDRELSFSVVMTYYTSLANILQATSLFKPLPNLQNANNWALWSADLQSVVGARGISKLGQFPSDQIVIDICESTVIPIHNTLQNLARNLSGVKDEGNPARTSKKPKPEDSYIDYRVQTTVRSKEKTIQHSPLDTSGPEREYEQVGPGTSESIPLPTTNQSSSTPNYVRNTELVTHKQGKTDYEVDLTGYAIRVGYPPSPPSLVSYGGLIPIKTGNDKIINKTLAVGSSGLTIYQVTWRKTYLLSGRPANGEYVTDGVPQRYV